MSQYEEDLIMHCRRSMLVGNNMSMWQKTKEEEFDVAIGTFANI